MFFLGKLIVLNDFYEFYLVWIQFKAIDHRRSSFLRNHHFLKRGGLFFKFKINDIKFIQSSSFRLVKGFRLKMNLYEIINH